ncbi:endogenous retrovirus group K member 9 Gag polyprotein-like [Rhinolophus ferrumequinum]|uniref:endogenous retrovirus group K member 9 Gag polyprotein-like n=1 Tax=Rhinolophus ferrumequinum TaxID=59479 RepID=UPI00140F8C7D|nr:endogenous retrovirus group K member 9 Gag polyprotein-like [Rhinolophus ferrumequinum]
MGHANSKDLYIRGLKKSLAARGSKVSRDQMEKFLDFVREVCPWFPDEGTVSWETWEKVGERLKDYYAAHGPQQVPVETFGLWTLVRDCLDLRHEGCKLEKLRQTGSEEMPPFAPETKGEIEAPNPPEELINLQSSDEQSEDLDPKDEEDLEEAAARYDREKYPPMIAVAQEEKSFLDTQEGKSLLDTVRSLTQQVETLQGQLAAMKLKQDKGSTQIRSITGPSVTFSSERWNSGGKDPPDNIALPPSAVPPTAPPLLPTEAPLWDPPLSKPPPPVWDMPTKPPPGYARPGSDSVMYSSRNCEGSYRQGGDTKHRETFPIIERVDQEGKPLQDWKPLRLHDTFPVFERADQDGQPQRDWRPFQWKLVKDLKEACTQYGPIAPFTMAIVDSVARETCTPEDWKHITHACLSGGDFLIWKSEFYENCKIRANENEMRNIPITFEMLAGEGPEYADARNQWNFAPRVYDQIASAAKNAWRMLPDKNSKEEQVTQIRQGADESFQDFVSRLTVAAGRTFGASVATEAFIKQLAYENANSACQAIIRPIKKKGTISDFIRSCADVGPSFSQGVALAAALQGKSIHEVMQQQAKLHASGRAGACFNCGKMGHRASQCPHKMEANNPSATAVVKKPPGPCPRCKKGVHWANECKSKTDKDGKPLQGNWVRGQPQAPTQQCYGALQVQEQTQEPKKNEPLLGSMSQTYSGPPQAAQDWTCVPPPTSY